MSTPDSVTVNNKFHNDMPDFKAVFQAIRTKIKAQAAYVKVCSQNRKLRPGPTMEERIAARAKRYEEIHRLNPEGAKAYRWDMSALLTTHRVMRGKPANHGIKPEEAQEYADGIIAAIRKELAASVAGGTSA